MTMPDRFSKEISGIENWAILDPENAIMGRIVDKQARFDGKGALLVIELTEKCRAKRKDQEVVCQPGDIVALDARPQLDSLEKHLKKPVEVYIRATSKTTTSKGNEAWQFQLGSVKLSK